MSSAMVLTLDLGSTNLKMAIIGSNGDVVKFASRPHSLDFSFLKEFCLGFNLQAIAICTKADMSQADYIYLPKKVAYLLAGKKLKNIEDDGGYNNTYLAKQIFEDDLYNAKPINKNNYLYSSSLVLGQEVPILVATFDFFALPFALPYPSVEYAFNRTGTTEGLNVILDNNADLPTNLENGYRLTNYPIGNYSTVGFVRNDTLTKVKEAKEIKDSYLLSFKTHLDNYTGIKAIYSTDGLSLDVELNQYKANLWQKPIITFKFCYVELLALALMAYTMLKYYKSVDEALTVFVKIDKEYKPVINNKNIL